MPTRRLSEASSQRSEPLNNWASFPAEASTTFKLPSKGMAIRSPIGSRTNSGYHKGGEKLQTGLIEQQTSRNADYADA